MCDFMSTCTYVYMCMSTTLYLVHSSISSSQLLQINQLIHTYVYMYIHLLKCMFVVNMMFGMSTKLKMCIQF